VGVHHDQVHLLGGCRLHDALIGHAQFHETGHVHVSGVRLWQQARQRAAGVLFQSLQQQRHLDRIHRHLNDMEQRPLRPRGLL
jgi:hypothetical protein